MANYAQLRQEMVREQLAGRNIRSLRVLEALGSVPREIFVPPESTWEAYEDRALPISCGQTISQPYIVALMLEALELDGTERVLEIGTGSGYQTALLSRLAREVVSIERHQPLAEAAAAILDELGIENATVIVGDGTLGWPAMAPYDRIIISAAGFQVPPSLVRQLAPAGLIVLPEGERQSQVLRQYHREAEGLVGRDLCPCRFVPLVGEEGFAADE